jgi:hypothetical protein
MPTTYTKAISLAAVGSQMSAAANAAYNDLALMTVGLLLRYDGTSDGTYWSKGTSASALYAAALFGNDGDFRVARSGTAGFFRGNAVTANNTWRWCFWTLNRSTGAHTRIAGPKGGTMASVTVTDIGGGAGTVNSDASFPLTVGSNGSNNASRVMQVACEAVWDSILSVSDAQDVNDDLSTAIAPVSYWIPNGSSTLSIANGISGLPAMTLTTTTLVDGPDSAPPEYAGLVVLSNPNTGPITSFPSALLPIVVRKVDQSGSAFTGGPSTATASAIGLEYGLTGTLTESFSGADATFDDLTATAGAIAGADGLSRYLQAQARMAGVHPY